MASGASGARFLLGEEPVEVRTSFRRPPGDTIGKQSADAELAINWQVRFPGGEVVTAMSAFDCSVNRRSVHGEKGSIELSPATSYHDHRQHIETATGRHTTQQCQSDRQFIGMPDEFALAVRENREPCSAKGTEGLQDLRLMERIYEAARTDRMLPVS